MDLEIAIITLDPENVPELLAAMDNGGTASLLSAPGCRSVKVLPGVENPGNVLFLVEWDSAEAHGAAKDSPGFQGFRAACADVFAKSKGGSMEHFRMR